MQYHLFSDPGSLCEEFPLPADEFRVSKFVEQPVTPVAAACDPVTPQLPEAKSACIPYQPEILPDGFPVHQHLKGRVLSFQQNWYKKFPWLHVSGIDGISCFYCTKYIQLCPDKTLVTKADMAFCGKGFKNWKKAIERFRHHEQCAAHAQAIFSHAQQKAPIERLLSRSLAEEQKLALESLMCIISTLKYLVRQGQAIRGHINSEGNFMELLKVRSENNPSLREWLQRDQNYTHPALQNEIIQILGNEIVANITEKIKLTNPLIYSVICDGTQDISGDEQVSVCIRWCDDDLEPQESFMGFYKTGATSGSDIASLICDALLRLQLPLANLRGQAYDGAGNMSGTNKGLQSIIIQKQPLADYVHCGAHCCNLVMKASCESSKTVKNAMEWAHQLGILFSNRKAKAVFTLVHEDVVDGPIGNIGKIKPLCPTRWLYRLSQIKTILNKYELVIKTLSELSEQGYGGASGLLSVFGNGVTYLGLVMGRDVIELLEILNKCFQGKKRTVAGLYKSVEHTIDGLNILRMNEKFSSLFKECSDKISELDLEELQLPRQKKVPKRIGLTTDSHVYQSCEEYYRQEYFEIIDTAVAGLQNRILNQPGVKKQVLLENILLQKEGSEELAPYPEIETSSFKIEIELFLQRYKVTCLHDARKTLISMTKEVRHLFRNVESLVRLLLVCPASSCEAERSFSALRNLKSYLRSTMTQTRLNHVAVCCVHKKVLDDIDNKKIAKVFISNAVPRRNVFGTFHD